MANGCMRQSHTTTFLLATVPEHSTACQCASVAPRFLVGDDHVWRCPVIQSGNVVVMVKLAINRHPSTIILVLPHGRRNRPGSFDSGPHHKFACRLTRPLEHVNGDPFAMSVIFPISL